jgi:hypothetical protein
VIGGGRTPPTAISLTQVQAPNLGNPVHLRTSSQCLADISHECARISPLKLPDHYRYFTDKIQNLDTNFFLKNKKFRNYLNTFKIFNL